MVRSWIEDTARTEPSKQYYLCPITIHILITKKDKKATLEAAATDQLAQMEALRAQLVNRRDELQTKIDQLTTKTVPTNMPPRGR